ncbi:MULTISPECIES: hypothetical protein [unclassified Sutcliffiella]|uniref:hypothetical protein n=1 Tax=unclassified Sutcliffiella TaxID=2837532 RepID=UPI0030CA6EFB
MYLLKYTAFLIALLTSIVLFLFAYFEAVRISESEEKVRGENVIMSFSLALFFAIMATRLS